MEVGSTTFDELKEKALSLPLKPGVYLMMDQAGTVIYVGKAKALKNRVSQYFHDPSNHNEKTRAMVAQIDHFDTIVAGSEFEALVLENSLIKRHKPHYNILLKDDKGYPYIRLSVKELSHYSNATTDFEFAFPFGWGELWGVASRTNYDLNAHQTTSGKDQTYFDQESGEHYIPFVIEPSLGADRVTLAFLVDAYDEEVVGQDKNGKDDVRVVLRLHPALAPFKCAVLPLSKKLAGPAQELLDDLSKDFMCDYDDAGSIGKRYRRQDEIGTPYCIPVDFDTVGDADKEGDHCVTVRDRDTMEQVRLPISELKAYLREKMAF